MGHAWGRSIWGVSVLLKNPSSFVLGALSRAGHPSACLLEAGPALLLPTTCSSCARQQVEAEKQQRMQKKRPAATTRKGRLHSDSRTALLLTAQPPALTGERVQHTTTSAWVIWNAGTCVKAVSMRQLGTNTGRWETGCKLPVPSAQKINCVLTRPGP